MNNSAIVIQVNKIEPIEGMDRIQLVKLFGTQVIVGKDIQIGDIMIYVDSNMKMSPEFLKYNNLYRHSELNADTTKSGYFDDSGRVKCIKMRGEISDGFLFSLDYLNYCRQNISGLIKVGNEFTHLGEDKICEKYIPIVQKGSGKDSKKNSGRNTLMFVEHFDTSQFMRNKHRIPAGTLCYIEEKIHGTSHRTGYVKVNELLQKPWWYLLLVVLGFKKIPKDYQYINGTRRVVHLPNTQKYSYHDNTMREEVLEHLKAQKLFKGEQLYMELFGYEKTGKEIQKGFPYCCEPKSGTQCMTCGSTFISKQTTQELLNENYKCADCGGNEFKTVHSYRTLLYRVTMNNEEGKVVDYSREYVYNRAEELGLEKPHLFEKYYYSGSRYSMDKLEEKVIQYAQGQSELANDTLKEGVVIWFINSKGNWEALKYKSDAFRLKESGNKDKGIIDQEDLN